MSNESGVVIACWLAIAVCIIALVLVAKVIIMSYRTGQLSVEIRVWEVVILMLAMILVLVAFVAMAIELHFL